MAYTILQYAGNMQNIKKCYLKFAHTQAHQITPEQTSPTVSDSHDIFKCHDPNAQVTAKYKKSCLISFGA
jgi:hypothetical protein